MPPPRVMPAGCRRGFRLHFAYVTKPASVAARRGLDSVRADSLFSGWTRLQGLGEKAFSDGIQGLPPDIQPYCPAASVSAAGAAVQLSGRPLVALAGNMGMAGRCSGTRGNRRIRRDVQDLRYRRVSRHQSTAQSDCSTRRPGTDARFVGASFCTASLVFSGPGGYLDARNERRPAGQRRDSDVVSINRVAAGGKKTDGSLWRTVPRLPTACSRLDTSALALSFQTRSRTLHEQPQIRRPGPGNAEKKLTSAGCRPPAVGGQCTWPVIALMTWSSSWMRSASVSPRFDRSASSSISNSVPPLVRSTSSYLSLNRRIRSVVWTILG